MAALSGFSSERRLLEFPLRPDDGLHYLRPLCARAAERRQRHRSATPPDFLPPVLRRLCGPVHRPAHLHRAHLPRLPSRVLRSVGISPPSPLWLFPPPPSVRPHITLTFASP